MGRRPTLIMLRPSINWLFAFIPVSLTLEVLARADPLLFFSAALAIVPIARLIVISTEQLATRTGDAVGGLPPVHYRAVFAGVMTMLR
jgi:Ca2+:H+ antiporter